jgi:hypothetical protein
MQQTGRKSPLKKPYNCINATLNGKKKRFLKKICNLSLKELFYSRSCCENAPGKEKTKMKLNGTIILALNRAAEKWGGVGNLGQKTGLSPSNISRYLSGKVRTVSDDNWLKLKGILGTGLFGGEVQEAPVIEWKELQRDPELLERNGRVEHLLLRVQEQQMAPVICDRDLVQVRHTETLKEIPENKIVLAVFNPHTLPCRKAVCKRLRKINGDYWFFSDEPCGSFFPAEKEKIIWSGVVLRKISEL